MINWFDSTNTAYINTISPTCQTGERLKASRFIQKNPMGFSRAWPSYQKALQLWWLTTGGSCNPNDAENTSHHPPPTKKNKDRCWTSELVRYSDMKFVKKNINYENPAKSLGHHFLRGWFTNKPTFLAKDLWSSKQNHHFFQMVACRLPG